MYFVSYLFSICTTTYELHINLYVKKYLYDTCQYVLLLSLLAKTPLFKWGHILHVIAHIWM